LTTAGFFFLLDELALDAAWVKETTLVAWSPDRAIIRPSTEDGPGDTTSEALPILQKRWLPYMAF
jgi:hypothetical protein